MEENLTNKDINICFLSGKIISTPEFNFFYNSKLISKISFLLQTEEGFCSCIKRKSNVIEVVAFDEMADVVYRYFELGDLIEFQGCLNGNKVVLTALT